MIFQHQFDTYLARAEIIRLHRHLYVAAVIIAMQAAVIALLLL